MPPKRIIKFFIPLFFLSSCSNEYWDYHAEKQTIEAQRTQAEASIVSFSPDQIQDRSVEILTTPDKKILDRIVSMIEGAKTSISLEIYILTEKRIMQALKNAKKRGVDVRVILEKNVFGATSINSKAFKTLSEAGVDVTYASNKLYNFTHSKLLIADDTYLITTGNFSYSSFTTNREFYVIGKNKDDLTTLQSLFDRDFQKLPTEIISSNLVISPENSRVKIEKTLESAGSKILLYAQTFSDDAITDILEAKNQKNINVIVCMADPKKITSNTKAIQELKSKNIDVRTSKKPVIHAKAYLVDDRYAYIGSENFTTNSLDNNREVGILLKTDPAFAQSYTNTFYSDCPKR